MRTHYLYPFVVKVLQLNLREGDVGFVQLWQLTPQVVAELLERRIEGNFVDSARELGATRARVGHNPGILKYESEVNKHKSHITCKGLKQNSEKIFLATMISN